MATAASAADGPAARWDQAPPLPDYTNELLVRAWYDVDEQIRTACTWVDGDPNTGLPPLQCSTPRLDRAIGWAEAIQGRLRPDARLRYLQGLAHRYAGRLPQAEASLRAALALDDRRLESWMELGELLATQGDHAAAFDAFSEVTTRQPEGPTAWFGWFARAQSAAHLHRVDAFETSLREALKHGFSFRLVEGQPAWQGFYADPALRPTLERMITVYGDPAVLDALDAPPAP